MQTPQHLRLSIEDLRIEIEMVDNPTTRDLLTRLPVTLEFEDFAGKEKIAYLPEPLETTGSPGSHPRAGDLTLYRPWGNLALFYADFTSFSDDLIPLGTVVVGHEYIDRLDSGPVSLEVAG